MASHFESESSSGYTDFEYVNNGKSILRAGYQYYLKKKYKNASEIWECSNRRRYKCTGSIVLRNNVILKENRHTCEANFEWNEVTKMKSIRNQITSANVPSIPATYNNHVNSSHLTNITTNVSELYSAYLQFASHNNMEDYDRSELNSAINSICNFNDEETSSIYIDHDYSNQDYSNHDYSNQYINDQTKDKRLDDDYTQANETNDFKIDQSSADIDSGNKTIQLLSKGRIQLKIDNTKVLMTLNKFANINLDKADEILKIEMCNSWGRCLEIKHVRHEADIAIQAALKEWSQWKMKACCRDTPLLYKCNDCSMAWWHLGPFREHLIEHNQDKRAPLKIHLESNFHECNLVARFESDLYPQMDVEVTSDVCWKCGKDYPSHGVDRYVCNLCNSQLYTCIQMIHHYGSCLEYRLRKNKRKKIALELFQCHICKLLEYTEEDLYQHYRIYHAVRSDLPVVNLIETCSLCKQVVLSPHICPKTFTEFLACKFCDRKFSCQLMYDIHRNTVKRYRCVICNKLLHSRCMEATHVAEAHGEIFIIIHKCILCDDNILFLNEEAMKLHGALWHKCHCKKKEFMEKVVLPKSCVTSLRTEDVFRVYLKGNHINVRELQEHSAAVDIPTEPGPAFKKRKYHRKYAFVYNENLVMRNLFGNDSVSEKNDVKTNEAAKENELSEEAPNYKIENVRSETTEDSEPRVTVEIEENMEPTQDLVPRVKVEIEDIDDFNDHIEIKEELMEEFTGQDDEAAYEHLLSSVFGQSHLIAKEKSETKTERRTGDKNNTEEPEIKIKRRGSGDKNDIEEPEIITELRRTGYKNETEEPKIKTERRGTGDKNDIEEPDIRIETREPGDKNDTEEPEIKTERRGIGKKNDIEEPEVKAERNDIEVIENNIEVIEILDESSDSDVPLIFTAPKAKKDRRSCKKCGFVGTKVEYDSHLPKCLNDYHCSKCDSGYRTLSNYVLHYIIHGYSDNHCPKCDETLNMGASLAAHVQKHVKLSFVKDESTEDFGYKCNDCKQFVQLECLFAHWESHLELAPYDSSREAAAGVMVDPEELSKKKLQYVIKFLEEKKQKYARRNSSKICKLCHKTFQRFPELKRHLIEHLLANALVQVETDSSFRCPICGCRLYGNNQFRTHLRNHAHFPVYQCEICYRSFSDSSNCAKHRKTHDIAAYTCTICKKKFHSKLQMEKHKALHQTQRSIKCKCCKKIFKQWSDYKRHKRNLLQKIIKRYPCQLCKKKFHTMKEKWTHQWEVHKLRDDESDCPVCLKPFRRLIDVKRHLEEEHEMCTGPKESQQLRSFFLLRKLKKIGVDNLEDVTSTSQQDENV